jgi:type I restriction enzyme S subunit
MIKEYSIPVPDFDIQQRVIFELKELDDLIDGVIYLYQKKVALLDDLKKSLLQKAFSGELTEGSKEAAA